MKNLEIKTQLDDMGMTEGTILINGQEVGWIEFLDEDDDVTISNFQIYDEFQKQGIGTAVLKDFIREYCSVTLAPTDENNLRLYKRVGFEEMTENAPEIDQGLGVWTI